MPVTQRIAASLLLLTLWAGQARAGEWDFSGSVSLETRVFPYSPAFSGQDRALVSPSISIEPELVYETESRDDRFTVQPFLRADAHDSHRTHGDIRIASWLHQADDWDLVVGIDKVFWGVTESRHLVDIVNQTDQVENIDGEDKLGQPMVNFSLQSEIGVWSVFALPGFRERTFPDNHARYRGPLRVDTDNPVYESGAEEGHVDLAGRWSDTYGDWDVGVSQFYGTSREPRLVATPRAGGEIVLTPHYDQIHQMGVDIQRTKDALLLKLEAITRSGHGDRFFAAVGGFEYTLFQIAESGSDLGLLAEFQYDGRDELTAPLTINDNDLFVGARWTLNDENDTSLLAGLVTDVETGTKLFGFEFERRLNDSLQVELEGNYSFNVSNDDPAAGFRDDDSVTLRLNYFY